MKRLFLMAAVLCPLLMMSACTNNYNTEANRKKEAGTYYYEYNDPTSGVLAYKASLILKEDGNCELNEEENKPGERPDIDLSHGTWKMVSADEIRCYLRDRDDRDDLDRDTEVFIKRDNDVLYWVDEHIELKKQ